MIAYLDKRRERHGDKTPPRLRLPSLLLRVQAMQQLSRPRTRNSSVGNCSPFFRLCVSTRPPCDRFPRLFKAQRVEGFLFDWMQAPGAAAKTATRQHNPHDQFRSYFWATGLLGRAPFDVGYVPASTAPFPLLPLKIRHAFKFRFSIGSTCSLRRATWPLTRPALWPGSSLRATQRQ